MKVSAFADSRILIVDDQADNLLALTAVLDMAGYTRITCLSDSRQLLTTFTDIQPDLILLDLHMPHMDGLDCLDQLAASIPGDDYLPVLVLTGDSTSGAKEKALSHGAHDFLSKPLNRTEVLLRVKNLLETRRLHLELKAQNASLEQQVHERTQLAQKLGRTNEQLRETQAYLVHSEKMAGLGQLAAGIAHEINNPLAFLINNLFLMQEALRTILPNVGPSREQSGEIPAGLAAKIGKMQARADDTQAGAKRVKELVSKLRSFSQLDENNIEAIDIHASIESALVFLQHRMGERIKVERHYGDVGKVTCFAGQLDQVLMNVIGNAIDSIDGPGRITLATARQDGDFVLRVRDTGKGIPEEIRNRIFEPFFTTKPVGEGMGLGLALSYAIVQAHRGSMEFSTQAGEGTEFVLRIPTSLPVSIAPPA